MDKRVSLLQNRVRMDPTDLDARSELAKLSLTFGLRIIEDILELCYVPNIDDGDLSCAILWFTTQPADLQWGDDWNDAPWQHNAGNPYAWTPSDKNPFYRLVECTMLNVSILNYQCVSLQEMIEQRYGIIKTYGAVRIHFRDLFSNVRLACDESSTKLLIDVEERF